MSQISTIIIASGECRVMIREREANKQNRGKTIRTYRLRDSKVAELPIRSPGHSGRQPLFVWFSLFPFTVIITTPNGYYFISSSLAVAFARERRLLRVLYRLAHTHTPIPPFPPRHVVVVLAILIVGQPEPDSAWCWGCNARWPRGF